jgi:hypothetical protein
VSFPVVHIASSYSLSYTNLYEDDGGLRRAQETNNK